MASAQCPPKTPPGVPPTPRIQHRTPGGMQEGKTGLAVIETTRPGPPWPHSRGERGSQCRLCSSLIAHSPSWLACPPHTQPRSAAGARLCSSLATEAPSSCKPLNISSGRPTGREQRAAHGNQRGLSPLPVPRAGMQRLPRRTCVPGTDRASPPPGKPGSGCVPGASR